MGQHIIYINGNLFVQKAQTCITEIIHVTFSNYDSVEFYRSLMYSTLIISITCNLT